MKNPEDPFEYDESHEESNPTIRQKIQEKIKKLPKKTGKASPYAAVVSVESSSVASTPEEKEEEEEGGNMNFLQRMELREKREVEAGIFSEGVTPWHKKSPVRTYRNKKSPASVRAKANLTGECPDLSAGTPNPIEKVKCSPEMKKFMMVEYDRERRKYSDCPETQIAHSVIHRYKTHMANSGKKMRSSTAESSKKPGTRRKTSSSPVEAEENEAESDLSISEFDEAELHLQPPEAGSFSLSPSPSQLRSSRNPLVRFTRDQESANITDMVLQKYSIDRELSPASEVNGNTKPGQKPKKKSPLTEKKVVEVVPRETRGRKRKAEEFVPSPVSIQVLASNTSVKGGSTNSQGDTKVRKTVTIKSQPEFFDVQDEIVKDHEVEAFVKPKSILKTSRVKPLPTSSPAKRPPDQMLLAPTSTVSPAGPRSRPVMSVKPSNLLAKFIQVSSPVESKKLSEENFKTLVKDMEKIHHSPDVSLEEHNENELKMAAKLAKLVGGRLCGQCKVDKISDLLLCSGCETVAYCDTDCQRKDWPSHKLVCAKFSGLDIHKKKDLILSVFGPNIFPDINTAEEEVGTPSPIKATTPTTPTTSPTLVNSVRSQSAKLDKRKRFLPSTGRRGTPYHLDLIREEFSLGEGFGGPKKLIFISEDVEDEVCKDVALSGSDSQQSSRGGDCFGDMFSDPNTPDEAEEQSSSDIQNDYKIFG